MNTLKKYERKLWWGLLIAVATISMLRSPSECMNVYTNTWYGVTFVVIALIMLGVMVWATWLTHQLHRAKKENNS